MGVRSEFAAFDPEAQDDFMKTQTHALFPHCALMLLAALMSLTPSLGASPGAPAAGAVKQPNIVFVVADDLGAWPIGAYGKPNCHTPHIDRLAAEGVVFENAFSVSVVCSPARAALITGRYPTETGIIDVLPNTNDPGLREGVTTWPQLLRSAGYQTALVGKWHLGQGRDIDLPTSKGYDEFSGFLQGGRVSREPVIEFLAPGQVRVSQVRKVDYEDIPGEQYTEDVLTELAIDFIRRASASERPFALSLHFWAPHANTAFPRGFTPPHQDRSWLPLREDDLAWWKRLRDDELMVPDPGFPHLDTARARRMMREYHASVHGVDRNLGRLLAFLNDPNGDGRTDDSIADNTLIVITSDHGFMMGHRGLWHKGNGRWLTLDRRDPVVPRLYGEGENRVNVFDDSLRVPCIVRWPARIQPGKREAGVVTHLDWLPTLAAIGGAALDAAQPVRGKGIAALTGVDTPRQDVVFAQYRKLRMVRSEGWKLVRHIDNPQGDELYNLLRDPDEKQNLLPKPGAAGLAMLSRLDTEMRSRMQAVQDPLLSELP